MQKTDSLAFQFVAYDIPNERILFLDETTPEVSAEDMRRNVVVMLYADAKKVRAAKGLPMPSPPVDVAKP